MDIKPQIDQLLEERQKVIYLAMTARADALKRIDEEYYQTVASASTECEKKIAEVLHAEGNGEEVKS